MNGNYTVNSPQARFGALLLVLLLALPVPAAATKVSNAVLARQLFDRTYQMVFGPQGASLDYAVNIIGIYKTAGTIWYKGNKAKFVESRYAAWNDAHTFYRVDKKKKTVEIHNPNSKKKDKYASKFEFKPDNYTYSLTGNRAENIISIDAKDGVDGIKHVKAVLDKQTGYPKSLKIKIAFFWTTVRISHFKPGGIDDGLFIFPRRQYASYEFIDKRPE